MSATYYSKSRGGFIPIAGMPTPHLSRAAKKLAAEMRDAWQVGDADSCDSLLEYLDSDLTPTDTLQAMIDELASRVPAREGA